MRSMKANRIVAILATISLLVGSLAVGGVLTASAVTDGWTAATVGQYKTFARWTQLSTMVGDKVSLIQGQTAYGSNFATDGDSLSDWYDETGTKYDGGLSGDDNGATDGKIASNANECATTEQIFRGNNATTSRFFYYDLGAVYDISDFVVASTQATNTNPVLKHVRIHVATEWGEAASFNTHMGAPTTGFIKIYENWSDTNTAYNYHIQPLDGKTVSGQYVCFELRCPQNISGEFPIAVGELAVYGTKTKEWKDSNNTSVVTKGRYLNFDRYADLSEVVSGDSLTKGKTPFGGRWASAAPFYHTEYGSGKIDYVADGKLDVSGTTEYTTIRSAANVAQSRYFYFDLGATYNITDFIAAPAQNGTLSSFSTLRIYVTNSAAVDPTTITKDNIPTTGMTLIPGFAPTDLVYSHTSYTGGQSSSTWTDAYNFHIQPTDGGTVTGRYVCFEIATTGANIYLGELAVYGERYDAWENAAEDRHTEHNRYTQLDTIMGNKTSLIANKVAYGSDYFNDGTALFADGAVSNWYNEGTLGDNENISGDSALVMKNGSYSGCEGGATDGKIAAAKDDTDVEQVFRNNALDKSRFFFYDLGATYEISDFLVASAQCYGTNAVLKNIRIYVAEEWSANTRFTYTKSWTADHGALDANNAPVGFTKVYENFDDTNTTYTYRIQPNNGDVVNARYVCFEFESPALYQSGNAPIPVGELAVYGEAVNTVKALGGQVAAYVDNDTVAKLRLGFDVAVTGVTVDSNYVGDYTNAKVTVNGTSYDIAVDAETGKPIIGALVARSKKALDEDLVVNKANDEVQVVHAKKIYDVHDDSITFTALITNVPSSHFDEQIIGRAYVGYKDGDTVRYAYGPMLSRSVDDVKTNTEMQ